MSDQSIPPRQSIKPRKPYPTFPLGAHRNGQWFTTKRIGGVKEFFYFGRWDDDPKGDRAFAAWKLVADDLRAGRRPDFAVLLPAAGTICAIEMAERFMDFVEARLKLGEIKHREFGDTRLACMGHFLDAIGERLAVVELDRPRVVSGREDPVTPLQLFREYLRARMGAYALHRNFDKVRRMLRWAFKAGLLPRPLHEHDALKRLPKKLVRREVRRREAENGVPIYSPTECRDMIAVAASAATRGSPILAMILLGLNGGCDAAWISEAPISAFDLENGFIDWVRPKTEELCRFPLWPITVFAVRQWMPNRPKPRNAEHGDRMFLTRCGNLFVREVIKRNEDGSIGEINPDDAVGKELVKVEKLAGVTKRRGRRFKALRRTHGTAANDIIDRDARRMIMGHGFEGMDPHYVRGLFPTSRLKVVTDHVGFALLGCVATECAWKPHAVEEKSSSPIPIDAQISPDVRAAS